MKSTHGGSPQALTAAQVASRLQVKVQTVYAYVSRGLLERLPADGKESQFAAVDVERLAARGRRAPDGRPDRWVIASALTEIGENSVHYRGRDVPDLARTLRFEQVAEWLWGLCDSPTSGSAFEPFIAARKAVSLARAVQHKLPSDTLPIERLRVIATVLGSSDPMRYETSRPAVIATARALMAGMVDALPELGPASADDSLAGRLWRRLSPARPSPTALRTLDAAMTLCADHALSPSTLAVRIAAAQRADPYAIVQTGMGTLSGVLHGAASLGAEELLEQVKTGTDPSAVIGIRLRRGEKIPGFGHARHPKGDPRASALLALLPPAPNRTEAGLAVQSVLSVMHDRALPAPNIDFALAALSHRAGMRRGSSEAIMAIARISGWIAHALEEYESPTPFPWDAAYVGPEATS